MQPVLSLLPLMRLEAWSPPYVVPRWALGGTGLPAGKSIVVLGTGTRGNSSSSRYLSSSSPLSGAPFVTNVSIKTNGWSAATSDGG